MLIGLRGLGVVLDDYPGPFDKMTVTTFCTRMWAAETARCVRPSLLRTSRVVNSKEPQQMHSWPQKGWWQRGLAKT